MALSRLGNTRRSENFTWPGFVDALASLLMVFVFVLMVFVLIQANLAYGRVLFFWWAWHCFWAMLRDKASAPIKTVNPVQPRKTMTKTLRAQILICPVGRSPCISVLV